MNSILGPNSPYASRIWARELAGGGGFELVSGELTKDRGIPTDVQCEDRFWSPEQTAQFYTENRAIRRKFRALGRGRIRVGLTDRQCEAAKHSKG